LKNFVSKKVISSRSYKDEPEIQMKQNSAAVRYFKSVKNGQVQGLKWLKVLVFIK
jgi:hypothetical protein